MVTLRVNGQVCGSFIRSTTRFIKGKKYNFADLFELTKPSICTYFNAMMDFHLNLDNIVSQVGMESSRALTFSNGDSKRQMLTLKSITSIRQLEFFVRNVSLYVYQSIYTLAKPDIQYIESLLENCMLEYGNVHNALRSLSKGKKNTEQLIYFITFYLFSF